MSKSEKYHSAGWILFFAATVVLRLFLSSDRDILALNSPHDEYWYVHRAASSFMGNRYSEMTLIHLPPYSAWLAILRAFGIPARLAIDLGWLLACGYLALALSCLTRRFWVAALAFAFLALHPYALFIFDRS